MNESPKYSMEQFPLRWRWTQSGHTLLPLEDLNRIRPCGETEARELRRRSLTFLDNAPADWVPSPLLFNEPEALRCPHDSDHIANWLAEHFPPEPTAIVVSWDDSFAVRTDTVVFARYWDSFCFPSSDDTSVWPLDSAWILQFFHEDVFYFATRRIT